MKEIKAMYQMVMSPCFRSIVWSRSGRSIVIENPVSFRCVEGPFFGFDRGVWEFKKFLVSHGFTKIPGSGYPRYYNKFFRKGRKDLLHLIEDVGYCGDDNEEEVGEMRKRTCEMMMEIREMKSEYKKNECMVSTLKDMVFSLSKIGSGPRDKKSGLLLRRRVAAKLGTGKKRRKKSTEGEQHIEVISKGSMNKTFWNDFQ